MAIRYLINEDGVPFDSSELQAISRELDALNNDDRKEYRDNNSITIARHNAVKILIVSGPGTGKTYLFLDKISHWYQNNSEASIFVTSFVRKLVADLQNDINNDQSLSDDQKKRTKVITLHKFARSIVEKNHGTSEWQFQPYFRIIGQSWKKIIWGDVLAFYPAPNKCGYEWEEFEEQLHNNKFKEDENWQNLRQTYFELCRVYNAAGFADLIIRARVSLEENPQLNIDSYFIIDEYQDFNLAEEALIFQLVKNAEGLLIVGDDEQVLYEKLKSGKAALIRSLYKNNNYVNAMLPFCARSNYHITKSTAYFIQQHRDPHCIEKIYLPLTKNQNELKVQVIACATATAAVDYIEKFIIDNKSEIEERKIKLSEGKEQDAFLLILTPAREINFYGNSKEKVFNIISDYQIENRTFSEDYYKVLNYYSLAKNNRNNFTFRKVLYYEGFSEKRVHNLIVMAIRDSKNFCDIDLNEVKKILKKCDNIKNIIDEESSIDQKIDKLLEYISISNRKHLKNDFEQQSINKDIVIKLEHGEEEEAELEEIEVKKMCAVELMTIVGSKGLSADHVIIIGFDNVNMNWVTRNAFYVAMTRARKSLHILTALKSGGARRTHSFLNQLPDVHLEFFSYKKRGHVKTVLGNKYRFVDYLNTVNSMSRRQR